jgi:hypothetical protein
MTKEITEEINTGMENEAPVEQVSLRKYRAKIKSRYPDDNPQTEEEWAELEDRYAEEVEGKISEYEGDLTKYKESDMKLQEIMTAYPDLAKMLYDIVVNKIPVRAAIAKNFEQEDLIPSEDDPDYPDYDSVLKEKKAANEKRSAIDAEIEKNLEESIAAIDAYASKKGYSDEQKQALLDFTNDTFQDLLMKKVTEPIWEAFDKAMNYDKDIEMAKEEGELKGKNAAIELKKASTENKGDDMVPQPGKGGGVKESAPSRVQQLFGDIGKRKGI